MSIHRAESNACDVSPSRTFSMLPAVAVFGIGVGWISWDAWIDPAPDLYHPAVLHSAHVAFAMWATAVAVLLHMQARPRPTGAAQFARGFWIFGCLMFLIHLAMAFHFAHHWRHAEAYEHVERGSGFGPGIFVSYAFSLIWAVDAIWLAVGPGSYVRRTRWLNALVHGFMAFVMFNATVVYGHSIIRWVGLAAFAMLALLLAVRQLRRSASNNGP